MVDLSVASFDKRGGREAWERGKEERRREDKRRKTEPDEKEEEVRSKIHAASPPLERPTSKYCRYLISFLRCALLVLSLSLSFRIWSVYDH